MDNQLFFNRWKQSITGKKEKDKDLLCGSATCKSSYIYLFICVYFIKRVRNETKTEIAHRLAHKLLRINFNFLINNSSRRFEG